MGEFTASITKKSKFDFFGLPIQSNTNWIKSEICKYYNQIVDKQVKRDFHPGFSNTSESSPSPLKIINNGNQDGFLGPLQYTRSSNSKTGQRHVVSSISFTQYLQSLIFKKYVNHRHNHKTLNNINIKMHTKVKEQKGWVNSIQLFRQGLTPKVE